MSASRRRGRGLAVLLGLAGATTAAAATVFARLLGADGWDLIDYPLLLLFIILYFWISIGFWTATFGFIWKLAPRSEPTSHPTPRVPCPFPRTAIVMPIYNEDPWRAMANLRAMRASLAEMGQAAAFDVFVLSDTRDPDIWAEEEHAWAMARREGDAKAPGTGLFYRRRRDNIDRKSGNIQDFCQRWGSRYRYIIILDADSLMSGETLVELVRRMEDDPQIGILQVPPVLVNRDSFFGRLLQFSSSLYGNVFRSGFTMWAKTEGNYWGHNAIIRVEPFMAHCGLPHLPGRPPWGGAILSHDFVEAALMLSAGWKVVVAADLGGSYEECPANLIDFAKRDERWSMGNLQHVPLVIAGGIHPVSRFHMGVGALSYLASPLWALFMLLSLVQGIGWHVAAGSAALAGRAGISTALALAPLGGALALLLMVKVWALLAVFRERSAASRFGTPTKLALSVLLETVVSCLVAPILMAFHTTFVINSLLGRKVEWEAQSRGENAHSFADTFRVHSPHTIAGLAAALALTWGPPGIFWWMLPILLGLIFSAPISLLLGSVNIGRRLRGAGFLLIPEETSPPPILERQRLCLAEAATQRGAAPHPFVRLAADPLLVRLHLALLKGGRTRSAAGGPVVSDANPCSEAQPTSEAGPRSSDFYEKDHAPVGERLRRIALAGGPAHLTRPERLLLMQDPEAIAWLHDELWKDWPLELLQKLASEGRG